jgi:release factor glutamine methyltransferase
MAVDARLAGAVGLRELLTSATTVLARAGVASPRVDAELLLAHVLGVPRGRLTVAPAPGADQRGDFHRLVERRAAREPLQHLVCTAAFRHLELAVGPGVFIPRPETELLVDAAAAVLTSVESAVVVDLCAGSGALGLAIHQEFPSSRVIAVERSEGALAWLRRNVASCASDGRCSVVAGDVSDGALVHHRELADVVGAVDVVVSNPPYVPSTAAIDAEVAHDPSDAVFAGIDGLALMPSVFALAGRLLRPGGLFVVEHSDGHGREVVELARSSGEWQSVSGHVDLAGRDRFVTAVRAPGPC